MSTVTSIGAEPARHDIETCPGEPVDFTIPVLDAAGAAQPLAGWTLEARSGPLWTSPALHTLTLDAVAPTGTPGEPGYDPGGIRVSATGDHTETWAEWLVPVARWSLWLTPPASQPYLFAAGWVRLTTH